jgi:hypothetical protein
LDIAFFLLGLGAFAVVLGTSYVAWWRNGQARTLRSVIAVWLAPAAILLGGLVLIALLKIR